MKFRPITARLGAKLMRRPLEAFAREIVEISPAVTHPRLQAISLPDELERVTGFHDQDPEGVREHLTEGPQKHAATTAYRLTDAVLADGCVYGAWSLAAMTEEKRRPILNGSSTDIDVGQLCTSYCGSTYFGDWLAIDTALELLAQQRGTVPLALRQKPYSHEARYREHLKLSRPMRPPGPIRVSSLWVVHDNGMTDSRMERFSVLRSRLRDPLAKSPKRVFIDRGSTGAPRDIGNKSAVLSALGSRGFEPIYPEHMAVDEIRSALSNAEICVGLEGSAMAHATMLMPEGASILFLFPDNRFFSQFKWFTDAFNMRFAYAVGDSARSRIFFDIDRLNRTLNLLD